VATFRVFNRPCVAYQIYKRVSKAYNQINGRSANGDAFVNWRTKCIAILNYYIYVPSLRAHACARDPTTVYSCFYSVANRCRFKEVASA